MIPKNLLLFFFVIFFSLGLISAQSKPDTLGRNLTAFFGIGGSSLLETYLSPYNYDGTDYRLIGESKAYSRSGNWLRQHWLSLDYARATNYSGRGLYHAGFIEYFFSEKRRYTLDHGFRFFIGGDADLLLGGIYNNRNDNNPAQAKCNLNLELSAATDYRFLIRNQPFVVSYRLKTPLLGVGFSPDYGESYYEIFQLGNRAGIVNLLSLHNQWALQNVLEIEIPFKKSSFKLGYFNNIYQSRIHGIETSLISNNILVGYSVDIMRLSRKKHVVSGNY